MSLAKFERFFDRVTPVFLLFLGLVFGGWLLAVGVIALIATLVGWLTAAVQEYRRTVVADTSAWVPSTVTKLNVPSIFTGIQVGAVIS